MSLEFRRPKVTIDWPMQPVSSDNVVVSASINAHTTVTFSAFSGSEASSNTTPVFSADAAKLMGEAQKLGFSKRTDADTTVTLEDGDGKTLEFKGFLVSPTFMMDTSSVHPGFAAVSTSAMLANLKLDIYQTSSPRAKADQPFSEGTGALAPLSSEPNLADRMKSLTEKLISYWKANRTTGSSTTSDKFKEDRDQINAAGPLKIWYELLKNSRKGLENEWLPKLTKDTYPAANEKFNNELLAILQGTSRDFQEVITALCSAFQLVHVPGIDGGAGHLEQMGKLLTAAPETLMLPANSVLLNGNNSHDLLPVQQVLISGTPVGGVATYLPYLDGSQLDGGNFLVGGFPEDTPSASGDVVILPAPAFVGLVIEAFVTGVSDAPPNSRQISKSRSRVSEMARRYNNEVSDKLIKDYARSIYIDTALGGTSTSINMPARLDLWPGTRYAVTNGRGEPLFTGFLAGVQHTFNKGQGRGSAMTSCNFTHILFPGFTLPGIT